MVKSAMERHKTKNGRESIGSTIINIVVRKKALVKVDICVKR